MQHTKHYTRTLNRWLLSALLVAVGHFRFLEKFMKFFVMLFTVLTLFAVAVVLPKLDFGSPGLFFPATWSVVDFAFLVALLGWLPTPIDVAVQQSLWTSAKMKSSPEPLLPKALILDFNIGYLGTAVLAICFVIMGAALIFASGSAIPDQPVNFAVMIISLYEQSIGPWIGPLIGVCAFAVMFSTMLTIFDGLPRTFGAIGILLRYDAGYEDVDPRVRHTWFNVAIAAICLAALTVMFFFIDSFKVFIDFATTVSFLVAPVIAWLNHRTITSADVPEDQRPGPLLLRWNQLGIIAMIAMAIGLLFVVFGR